MEWIPFFLICLGVISGMFLFRKKTIPDTGVPFEKSGKISVIIPARNEEKNLPALLESIRKQTLMPDEIIVVDDHSVDRTAEVALRYSAKVFSLSDLPEGWTGKTWAVWNGYLRSAGDILVFLDADVRLKPEALRLLIGERNRRGGVISVVPYHVTEKFYERLAMIPNILGVFAFTSPFEEKNVNKGLYGSCIVATRADYEKIGGHESIKSEMLDDLNLGARFQKAGIAVTNYIGKGLVAFRMYPNGWKSELEGFAKGAVLSPSQLSPGTLALIVLWFIGMILSQSWFFMIHTSFFYPLFIGFLLYIVHILYLNQFVGRFGIINPLLPFLSVLFFLVILLYSLYQVVFRRSVVWKGRQVPVGRRMRK